MPILALVLMIAAVAGTMVTNNVRLNAWKKGLHHLAPPPDTRVVATGTEFGLLSGNGNHCDKRAWIMLRTSLPVDEVERHYAGHLETTSLWISVSVRDAEHVSVEMVEVGGAAGWDPRCH